MLGPVARGQDAPPVHRTALPPVQLHGDHLVAEALAVLREVVDVRLARATYAARGDVVRVGLVARIGERDDRVVPRAP